MEDHIVILWVDENGAKIMDDLFIDSNHQIPRIGENIEGFIVKDIRWTSKLREITITISLHN